MGETHQVRGLGQTGGTAVLGGGALGLTVALRLAQRGERVTVIEREPVPGGLAAGFQPAPELPGGGPYLEKFYHHLFRSDTTIAALIEELGLGDRLVWPRPTNAVLWGGRFWRPYTPRGLLRFSPLPLVDRVRMGVVLAYLKLQRDYRPYEGVTADRWLRRWLGERAYGVLWEPLLRAKFGDRFDQIAMSWFWARIYCRSMALGYLRGGFQQLYDALVAEIRRLGGEVLLGREVTGARFATGDQDERGDQDGRPDAPSAAATTDERWTVAWRPAGAAPAASGVATSGETSRRFERVVSTLPIRLTLRLVPQLPENYRRQYDWGEAYGAHCVVLSLDRPLLPGGAYWLNVNDPSYPFLVAVEHTNYMPPEDYGGRRLVYLGNYLPMDHPLFAQPKEATLAQFLPSLRQINPAFREDWVRESWLFGAPYAQPIVTCDYARHIPPLKAPLPGLWIGSMFQVYPQDRGQNYSVALGNRLAEAMIEDERRATNDERALVVRPSSFVGSRAGTGAGAAGGDG
ncbi:MAG: NAD(P)/FAD-dependent oxidoreductase [Chloroflexi bacterium]|nr:NAD(P)/FAD-dependent oxidoreductase [Chloroflexota bacterium]